MVFDNLRCRSAGNLLIAEFLSTGRSVAKQWHKALDNRDVTTLIPRSNSRYVPDAALSDVASDLKPASSSVPLPDQHLSTISPLQPDITLMAVGFGRGYTCTCLLCRPPPTPTAYSLCLGFGNFGGGGGYTGKGKSWDNC